jgi:SAM-dependent methyltransferase
VAEYKYRQVDGTERWDRNAASWHKYLGENDPSRKYLLDPIILELLGDISGKRVLDAGCGDGYLSRKLAKLGAEVAGVELAPNMLSFALEEQEKTPLKITYYNGTITSLPFLSDHSFDIIITNNVIQDVEDYKGAFRELSRLLRPGGTYLHIANHPCFMTPGWGWERDAEGKRMHWKVDYYFSRGPISCGWRPEQRMEPTIYWHRTLGDIVNTLISCKFRIIELLEPEPPDSWRASRPQAYEADMRKPDFLVIVCCREDES